MIILKPEFIRTDERGILKQISTGEWKQVNILEIKKGCFFGGHYHKHKKELFYIIEGYIGVTVNKHCNMLKTGDMFLIKPYDKHEILAVENSILVELLSQPYNHKDIYND